MVDLDELKDYVEDSSDEQDWPSETTVRLDGKLISRLQNALGVEYKQDLAPVLEMAIADMLDNDERKAGALEEFQERV